MDLAAQLTRLGACLVADRPARCTEDDVAAIEALIGAPLPADYRWFLTEHGRCGFEDTVVITRADGHRLPLDELFGAPEPDRVDDVLRSTEDLEDVVQPGEVCIGDDLLGDPWLLDVRNGDIWFVDLHSGAGRTLATSTFTNLLAFAHPDEDEEEDD